MPESPLLLTDPDVDLATRAGGVLQAGPWALRLPGVFGFCGGVQRAVRTLEQTVRRTPGCRIWLLGEVIHNNTVNQAFRDLGVHILDESRIHEIFDLTDPSDVVVIPAFGVPEELDAALRERLPDARIVDTTCEYVKRVWRFAGEMARQGRTVLIHGKPAHPETRATLSRALTPANAVVLLPDVDTAEQLATAVRTRRPDRVPAELVRNRKQLRLDQLALVNQTTMLHDETRGIEAVLIEAVRESGGELLASETVCRATQQRQTAASALCRQNCDLFLVVGGYSSSNTNQLFRLAAAAAPAFFITGAEALTRNEIRHLLPVSGTETVSRDWLPGAATVGILAGASCPAYDIGQVIRKFRTFAAELESTQDESVYQER